MKILYYDSFAGISGDMNLGALIDLGVPEEYLITELNKLKVDDFELQCKSSIKNGISGKRANVISKHHHTKSGRHKHDESKFQPNHRNLKDISNIIESSSLSDYVKGKSLEIFFCIAEAEARIHSKSVNEIHFHEVGAIDSIVDIVGAALCIEYLKPDKIFASTVELGGGFVECDHGTYPIPAPATVEILKGIPVRKGTVDKETTTPTGAAILKVFVNEFTDRISFQINKTGYGIGYHDLAIPNVLRIYQGELNEVRALNTETSEAILIECNIDDMNPEQYEFIMEKLFDVGAQDVFLVPIIMKKSRPAIQLKVLCARTNQTVMENLLLHETTSLGVRHTHVTKSMLHRNTRTIKTQYGPIRVKEATLDGKVIKYKAEYDDCANAARAAKVSLKEIYREVDQKWKNKKR